MLLYIIWFAFTDAFIELEEVNNGEGLMKLLSDQRGGGGKGYI